MKAAARMKGLDDADIVVAPPKDLLDSTMSAADFARLFGVYTQGGMSWETFYERGQADGIFRLSGTRKTNTPSSILRAQRTSGRQPSSDLDHSWPFV